VGGMGSPARLYPISILTDKPEEIVICEGEFDALVTIQAGFPAITKTSSAKTWDNDWNEHFRDKVVYICNDMDFAGQDANRKIARALKSIAKEVKVVQLPADIKPKHGYDLSDYFLEHTAKDFRKLLRATPGTRSGPEEIDPTDVSVLESFDSRKVGDPMRLTVTIKGKHEPGYSIPHTVKLSCTRDYGDKCNFCPMNSAGGEDKIEIPPHDPLVMELMESERDKVLDMMRKRYGVPVKCPKLDIDVTKHQAVEVLFARPSVEHVNGSGNDAGDYKNIKITSVGRHSTMPNNTVTVLGSLQPDPRRQLNQFQAWEIAPIESGLDEFVLDKSTIRKLRKFQPRGGQSPLNKIGEIARELEEHVTYIYGRPEMHALMDLVWHSALAFNFGGRFERRGWLEALVIGDTRTGKSEAAARLSQHYSAGEIVTCESASFAGIVGGLQQYGAGKEWSVNWGVVPLNDRRLVVLDEVGGLEPDEIAQLSDVRSSGVAQLTKIQQERTLARTRLLWLGNPRNARMADFTYGVQAIRPLIGNSEDIARFDLAMSVKSGEVSPDTINRARGSGELKYDAESCGALIRWTWSRSPDSIVWGRGAERTVFKLAKAMGARYVEDPPLVQAANIRIKIARVAVAIAARTFSTDRTGEKLIVLPQHVKDAMQFMDILYSMRGFGYAERSSELIADRQKAVDAKQDVKKYLRTQAGLAKFLRGTGHFRRQDLEEILDVPREEANSIINRLWESRMVRKDKGNVVIEPTLHELLREVK
jgi:5S rRNA maturation endonuclease (ribonuclease M5)